MQMRNLLRLIGSLALTSGVATSAVACGEQAAVNLDTVLKNKKLGEIKVTNVTKPTEQELKNAIKAVPENKDINLKGIIVKAVIPEGSASITSATVTPDGTIYNGNEITVTFTLIHKKTDVDVTNDIKTALEEGVDGSSLNTSQKQSDAKDLITAAIKQVTDADKVAAADFTIVNGDTVLTAGDNKVDIKVTFGEAKDVAIAVNLTGVTAHKKTDVEVINDIKTALEEGVDGSSLNTSQKQSDAKDLITAAIKQVTDADKVAAADFTIVNGDTVLTAGDNKVDINVTFGEAKDVAIAVNLTGVTAHKKTDVEVINDIKTALEEGVDGSSLNTSQKQSDAKDLITAAIKQVTDADKVAAADFTIVNGDTVLTAGDNKVDINVTFGEAKGVAIAVNLTGVTTK
ncbi:hypothetical protein [Spiroplasma endosymbiont of Polydrusus pterygomalis]|uniref:hypothetical protein n=1 Tax=Spiroplasma endosymbiont of Polydrusus pterygomalis TaxID=3139327 RepID=UPI003CCB1729